MASFNVVINSRFKPFSYQEMLHPVMMADLEHKTIDAAISELGTKANVWEGMANELSDPKAYKMYNEYSNALKELANTLASQGLNQDSRRAMNNLRERYSSDIVPIELAYTRRRELQDELRKLRALNPSIIYDRNMDLASLDDLISNPSLLYQSVSGALLTQLVGQAAANLKKQMQTDLLNNPESANKWKSLFGGLYYERILRDGFSLEDVLAAMLGLGPKILTDLVQSAIQSSGVLNWNNPDAMKQASYYANQGLYNAIGDYKVDRVSNKQWDLDAQLRLAMAKKKLSEKALPLPNKYYRTTNSTKVDGSKETTQIKEDYDFLKKMKDNPKLINEPSTKVATTPVSPTVGAWSSSTYTSYPNKERYDKLVKKYGTDDFTKISLLMEKDVRSSAIRSQSFIPHLTSHENLSEIIALNVKSQSNNNTHIYKFENGKKGDQVDLDKFNEKVFTKDAFVRFEPSEGFVVTSTDDKGKVNHYLLDLELLDRSDRLLSNDFKELQLYLQEGDEANALDVINEMLLYVNDLGNSRTYIQGKTSSKDDKLTTDESDYLF